MHSREDVVGWLVKEQLSGVAQRPGRQQRRRALAVWQDAVPLQKYTCVFRGMLSSQPRVSAQKLLLQPLGECHSYFSSSESRLCVTQRDSDLWPFF